VPTGRRMDRAAARDFGIIGVSAPAEARLGRRPSWALDIRFEITVCARTARGAMRT